MKTERFSISLECCAEKISQLRTWADSVAAESCIGNKASNDLKFALVELFTNAVRHASQADKFHVLAAKGWSSGNDGQTTGNTVRIFASYFDPNLEPAIIPEPSLTKPAEGGYGVFLARSITSHFRMFKFKNGMAGVYFRTNGSVSDELDKPESYDYELPQERIAQYPVEPRDSSKMLVLKRESKSLEDRIFCDIEQILEPGTLIILNNTRVMHARLIGHKKTGARVEAFLLREEKSEDVTHEKAEMKSENGFIYIWRALLKPGRRLKKGDIVIFENGFEAEILDNSSSKTSDDEALKEAEYDKSCGSIQQNGKNHHKPGERIIAFREDPRVFMRQHGIVPLPPYITEQLNNPDRYQTVYAEKEGAVAAPTAGLHFTPELMDRMKKAGFAFSYITLHVGAGTFLPVRTNRMSEHPMHSEWVEISSETASKVNQAHAEDRMVLGCGTTVVRSLEYFGRNGKLQPGSDWCDIYILPGYKFRIVDAMLTNFHLPKTTLLGLVSAFSGYEFNREAYDHAVKNQYRFYSFGDAMLII